MTSLNIDQWLSGAEDATILIEAMAIEIHGELSDGEDWSTLDADAQDMFIECAHAALRAALSLTTTELCKVCGGKGYDDELGPRHEDWVPCPGCDDGTAPGESVVVLREQLEQVGWVKMLGQASPSVVSGVEPGDDKAWPGYEPAYRLRPLEKEDET